MKKLCIVGVIAAGLWADALAGERRDYAPISFVVPSSGGSSVSKEQFVTLVVEGAFFSHDKQPVPSERLVPYVDSLLQAQGASYVAVHVREGVKYGDVVRALDSLRTTSAKSIAVTMVELPAGRDL